ncbi:MAG: GldM family protein [Bacteroidota bacterium]
MFYKFEPEVFLLASSSHSTNTGVSNSVNGRGLPVSDGVAKFTETANSTGVKKYKAAITVTNPVTGEKNTYNNEFEYEVGLRSCNVSADKMNVFYIGVDNPVSVSAAGVPTHTLKVNGSGGGMKMKPNGKGKFVVTVDKPTAKDSPANITVSGEGLSATRFPFRVKRIPDPIARLSKSSGGAMGNGEFKAQGGVGAFLDNFDFDAVCKIQGFSLTYVAKRQDPVESVNPGARYNAQSKRLVTKAKPGDIFYFDNVKARCPGDKAGRKINSMVFKIK